MMDIKIYSNYLNRASKDEDGYYNMFDNTKYTKVERLWDDTFSCVIHMYPLKDTTDEEGTLLGYDDSLFFKAVIYNEDKKEYYVTNGRPLDNINSWGCDAGFQIRMFKDQSMMLILQRPVEVRQSCSDLEIKLKSKF